MIVLSFVVFLCRFPLSFSFVVLHIPISLFSSTEMCFELFDSEGLCRSSFKQFIGEVRYQEVAKFGFGGFALYLCR